MHTLLLAAALAASTPEARDVTAACPPGEVLTYRVRFAGLSAGRATMAVGPLDTRDGRPVLRLQMRTVSTGLFGRLMRVDDLATSLVAPTDCQPLEYRFEKSEGDRNELEQLTIDRAAGKAFFSIRRHDGKLDEGAIELPAEVPVLDTLSLFYYLRTARLTKGSTLEVVVLQKKKAYPVRLVAEEVESIRVIGTGVFKALRVRPASAAPGLFSPEGEAVFWIEETTGVLLRMVVELRYGSSAMYLSEIENSPLLAAPGGPRAPKR
jgi:hypothetical protein